MKDLPKAPNECWCSLCGNPTTAHQILDFYVVEVQKMKVSLQAAKERAGLHGVFGGHEQPGAVGLAEVFASKDFCKPEGDTRRLILCELCALTKAMAVTVHKTEKEE